MNICGGEWWSHKMTQLPKVESLEGTWLMHWLWLLYCANCFSYLDSFISIQSFSFLDVRKQNNEAEIKIREM
jgi:hypothetical protein